MCDQPKQAAISNLKKRKQPFNGGANLRNCVTLKPVCGTFKNKFSQLLFLPFGIVSILFQHTVCGSQKYRALIRVKLM